MSDPSKISAVLRGAARRMAAGGVVPDLNGCECDHRADNDVHSDAPWPADDGEGRPWCILCAIEAEVDTTRVGAEYYSHALDHLAAGLTGRPFTNGQGDAAVIRWSGTQTREQIIARLNALAGQPGGGR